MNSFNLDNYLKDSYYFQYPSDIEVTSITFNSKKVKPHGIFVAIKGFKTDGNNYINEAILNGASLIVSDTLPSTEYPDVGFLMVKNARRALSALSQRLYDYPDKKLKIIAVTGTDGKTTTSFFTYQLLKKCNYQVGLISTTNIDTTNELIPSPYRQSTPDGNILFYLLAQCVENNKEYVVLEATSHALSPFFSRLAKMEIDAAIITTITQEHLDFHLSEEDYIKAKLNIIEKLKPNGLFISSTRNNQIKKCIEKADQLKQEHLVLEDYINYSIIDTPSLEPLKLKVNDKSYQTTISLPILINDALLATLCVNRLTSVDLDTLLSHLSTISQIKGRFNIIENAINRMVIVDFAHTSDAFEKVFSKVKLLNKRIIVLFGCGGERDIIKRQKMGEVAGTYCDIIILTEEDPRFEDNNNIMNNIEKGITKVNNSIKVYKVNDRLEAIEKAFKISEQGDILLFLGKGHETSIERSGTKYPYDETIAIKEVINKLYE